MKRLFTRLVCLIGSLLLTACAASSLPGFQNAYRAYNVPQPLVEQIRTKFASHGLTQASVARDNTGRIQLVGTYRDEDEVDAAFLIVQTIRSTFSRNDGTPKPARRWRISRSHRSSSRHSR
jgi:hypothetical protein